MSAIRNIEKEAKFVNEMFPNIDYLFIIELLKECRSVDEVIEQIHSGNQSDKWEKSKNDQKKIVQTQSQQVESDSTQTNNSTTSENQLQPSITSKEISKHNYQASMLNNDKNTNENKQTQFSSSEISVQIEKQYQPQLQISDTNDNVFTSDINPPKSISFNHNTIQQPSNNQTILTLPKCLQGIKPNMSRFGSFAGPINTSNQNTNLTLNYSSSSSTSSLNLYTSPPSSYNSASTKISLSSEENKFESFQSIITKDATTQLNTYDDPNPSSIDGIGYGIDSMNDINRENDGESGHQIKYRNLQNPGYSRYQTTYLPIMQPQQMQQLQQQQQLQLQQQQMFQQQQQQLMMQMQTPNFQPLSQQQQQTQQVFSPQYMPPDPKFMVTQQQMVSQFNLAMPQNSQENVVGNK